MIHRFILTVSAIGLVLGMTTPVDATKPLPPTSTPEMVGGDSLDAIVANFPKPAPGMRQFVIMPPAAENESSLRLSLIAGRMEVTDGINRVGIAGELVQKTLTGFGYNYFEVEGGDGPSMTTLIGVPPGTPQVTKFISLQEKLIRYNSLLPVVIYAPHDFEIRYRIFEAGPELKALIGPSGGEAVQEPRGDGITQLPAIPNSGAKDVILSGGVHAHLPKGSTATIRLYDSRLMDADSTYAVHTVSIEQLPAQLPMPDDTRPRVIVGPAVSVSIRDAEGKLLYWSDSATPISETGPTSLKMRRAQ